MCLCASVVKSLCLCPFNVPMLSTALMPHLYDISPILSPTINVWPGDTPLTREVLCEISKGATVTLSTMHATVHLGAHADGPNHYGDPTKIQAPDIASRSLDFYLGPCTVIDAPVPRGTRVAPSDLVLSTNTDLKKLSVEPRVLIRTSTFPDFENWNQDFAGLSVELIDFLATKGVRTIGVDTPSVDLQESKDLPAHKAILRNDISILEGLVLRDVPPGRYELIALPLRLVGFDASPVRAILRTLS